MADLSHRALLVSLQISQWSARKFDRKETAELALKHGTMSEVARVNKSLLPMSQQLDAIHKKTNEIRWTYYRASLPWGQEGVNVISTAGYMDFVKMMREGIAAWRQLVDDFLIVYPQLREDARLMLNGMYREEDYPDAGDLARKFDIDIKFFPVPAEGDWRVELADDEIDRLREQTIADIQSSQNFAMRDAWRRVHEMLTHAVDRLSDPKAVFRDSLVENAKQMCKTLTVLNIVGDADLEKIRSDIEGSLCSHNGGTLRGDPAVREAVSDKMKEIMAKMGAFYSA